jgi:hypothetical protein
MVVIDPLLPLANVGFGAATSVIECRGFSKLIV